MRTTAIISCITFIIYSFDYLPLISCFINVSPDHTHFGITRDIEYLCLSAILRKLLNFRGHAISEEFVVIDLKIKNSPVPSELVQ